MCVDDDELSIEVTISIGFSGGRYQPNSECVDWCAEADNALYAAKDAGRNAVAVYWT